MPLEIHAQVLDFQGSKLILSVARDLSERKRSAEIPASITAQMQLVAKLEALGTFAGGIAHEFNNVLGTMKGYLELACMTLDTVPGAEKIRTKLEASLRAGDRARDLVKQILAFSRQNERAPATGDPVDHEGVAQDAAGLPAQHY